MNEQETRLDFAKITLRALLEQPSFSEFDEPIVDRVGEIVDAMMARFCPPSTIAADDDGWIAHRTGDPMPVGGDVIVRIKSRDGYEAPGRAGLFGNNEADEADWWTGLNAEPQDCIIAYKLA